MKASEEKALGREEAGAEAGERRSPIMAPFGDPFMGRFCDQWQACLLPTCLVMKN